MLCYILYVGMNWPGLATSVTTCVLTALSNIAPPAKNRSCDWPVRHRRIRLRPRSQLFVLPYIDSITGFTVLFAVVSAAAAYVSTSGPRLSYAGLQIASPFISSTLAIQHPALPLRRPRPRHRRSPWHLHDVAGLRALLPSPAATKWSAPSSAPCASWPSSFPNPPSARRRNHRPHPQAARSGLPLLRRIQRPIRRRSL